MQAYSRIDLYYRIKIQSTDRNDPLSLRTECFYKQPLPIYVQMIFHTYNTKQATQKNVAIKLIQKASSISNDNNLTSQNFNSFSDEKNICFLFLRTLRILSCCNFLVRFLSKRHYFVEAKVYVAAILHSILFEIVCNLSFCDNCVDLIDL